MSQATVWIATRKEAHENWTDILGVYSCEMAARIAVKQCIDAELAKNPHAKEWWAPSDSIFPHSARISWGCGHSDDYDWSDYDVNDLCESPEYAAYMADRNAPDPRD
jgi:hypothetical protein